MGKNTAQTYGASAKGDLLFFDPEQLVVVTDPKHPLYDERAELEPEADFVANIKYHGVLEPVLVTKRGEAVEVVAGRQRVMAARIANKQLRAEGLQPIRVPAVTKRGEDYAMLAILISENEHRRADTPIVRAKKVQRFLDLGRSMEEAAIVFGKSLATVKSDLSLLELPQDIQTALEADVIPTSAAKKLAAVPEPKRAKAIKKKAAEKGTRKRSKKPAKTDVKTLIKALRASGYDGGYVPSSFAADVLEYAFGLTDAAEFEEAHKEIFK